MAEIESWFIDCATVEPEFLDDDLLVRQEMAVGLKDRLRLET